MYTAYRKNLDWAKKFHGSFNAAKKDCGRVDAVVKVKMSEYEEYFKVPLAKRREGPLNKIKDADAKSACPALRKSTASQWERM